MSNLLRAIKPLAIKTIFFSLIIGAITAIFKYLNVVSGISNFWYWLLVFYFAITLLIFYLLTRALQKSPRKFVATFFAVSLGRIVLFTAIILLYAVFIKTAAVSFILTFAAYYILFTFWEVILILPVVKGVKTPNN
ncbi:MAG: hypothetical protein LBH92_07750 [Bacteroidales bacterium]|jgi:hypothetical protein|nr:hypothetical protein [Bacteroidales bacterium]